MNAIKLTKAHKSKLLEMCEKLFKDKDHNLFKITLDDEILWVNKKAGINKTHWFEFVFMYLVGRIQEKMPDEHIWRRIPLYVTNVYGSFEGTKWTLYSEFMFHYPKACFGGSVYPTNPIDFLYEEFKKIKTT